jgi:hypothetical protein
LGTAVGFFIAKRGAKVLKIALAGHRFCPWPLLPPHIACDRMHRDHLGRKKHLAAFIFNHMKSKKHLK